LRAEIRNQHRRLSHREVIPHDDTGAIGADDEIIARHSEPVAIPGLQDERLRFRRPILLVQPMPTTCYSHLFALLTLPVPNLHDGIFRLTKSGAQMGCAMPLAGMPDVRQNHVHEQKIADALNATGTGEDR
jgi:hypothetical protein